jgi:hypothetical protein
MDPPHLDTGRRSPSLLMGIVELTMKTFVIACFALGCLGTTASAQCNPSIAGTCGANDPALLGQQQLQQNRTTQQLQMMQQNQQLQDIQRDNVRRYEQQQLAPDRSTSGVGVPQIVRSGPPGPPHQKAKRSIGKRHLLHRARTRR